MSEDIRPTRQGIESGVIKANGGSGRFEHRLVMGEIEAPQSPHPPTPLAVVVAATGTGAIAAHLSPKAATNPGAEGENEGQTVPPTDSERGRLGDEGEPPRVL